MGVESVLPHYLRAQSGYVFTLQRLVSYRVYRKERLLQHMIPLTDETGYPGDVETLLKRRAAEIGACSQQPLPSR